MNEKFFYLSLILLLISPFAAKAATLSVSGAVHVRQGDMVTESIRVSASEAINAISGTISFPTKLLKVSTISKAGSVLILWVQEPSSGDGTVAWSGVVPNPGYTGLNGKVISITFKALSAGAASIAFSSAQVLANDGNGTDVLTGTSPANISITSVITPNPHPPSPVAIKTSTSSLPTTPQIQLVPIKDLSTSDKVIVIGKTYGRASIALTLQDSSSATTQETVTADTNGNFEYVWPYALSAGQYTITAKTVNTHTGKSIESSVNFSVLPIADNTTRNYPVSELVLICIVGILVVCGLAWLLNKWYLEKTRRLYRTQMLLHEEFLSLRQTLADEIHSLDQIKAKRKLTEEEDRIIAHITKLLDKTERVISRKLL